MVIGGKFEISQPPFFLDFINMWFIILSHSTASIKIPHLMMWISYIKLSLCLHGCKNMNFHSTDNHSQIIISFDKKQARDNIQYLLQYKNNVRHRDKKEVGMKRIGTIIIALAVVFWVSRTAKAMWVDIPLDKLVADNPVVLVGTIEDISVSKSPKDKFDIAYIKVADVLKNELENRKIKKGENVPLSMPSAKKVMISTDIRYKKGTEGVWILEYEDETFWATYPKDYQPLKQREQIAQIIQKQMNKPDLRL